MSRVRTQAHVIDPVVSANAAYTSGDVVGDLQAIIMASVHGAGVLKDVKVIDIDNQAAPLTVLYFRGKPSGIAADNAAFSLSAADAKLLVAKVDVAASDYETINGRAVADVEVSKVVRGGDDGAGGQTSDHRYLWVVLLTTGTPTYTTTGSLRLVHGILNDN